MRSSELAGLLAAAAAFAFTVAALLTGTWWLLAAGVLLGLVSLRIRW